MTCKFDETLLYEYLDDLLEADEKIMVNNHLSACPHCRQKLSEIKLLFYELDNIAEVEIPDELEALRLSVVESAFEVEHKTLSQSISSNLKKTKETLENTPVISQVIPNKENLSAAGKGLLNVTKKAVGKLPKKEKKEKKSLKKSLGGLL